MSPADAVGPPEAAEPPDSAANERTALAWQRTALSLLAGAAIVARLAVDRVGVLAVMGFALSLPLAGWVLWESRGRYHHDAGIRERPRPRGGRAPTMLVLMIVLVTATELSAMAVGDR